MNKEQNQMPSDSKSLSKSRIIFGIAFIVLSIVLVLSFISYLMHWKSNQSQAGMITDKTIKSSNIFGKIGDWLGNLFIFESVGVAAFVVAFLFFVFGTLIIKKNYFKPWKTISHSLFFICWLPIFFGAVTNGEDVLGGIYGYQIMDYLKSYTGFAGLWLILLVSIALYFILEFNIKSNFVKKKLDDNLEKFKTLIPDSDEKTENKANDEKNDFGNIKVTQDFGFITTPNQTTFSDESLVLSSDFQEKKDKDDFDFKVEEIKKDDDFDINSDEKKANELVEKHGLYDHKLDLASFQMPPVELLKDYGNEEITINKDELEENKNRIVGLLKTFNVGISEIKATIGPTVTLYEIVPAEGIRVAAIKKLQDDIALNLSALGIRIIAPMPGKGTIGIEVPRKNPTMVSMRSVIASPKFQNAEMDLPIVFGRTISNEVFVADLTKMPHLLMAGATGQ